MSKTYLMSWLDTDWPCAFVCARALAGSNPTPSHIASNRRLLLERLSWLSTRLVWIWEIALYHQLEQVNLQQSCVLLKVSEKSDWSEVTTDCWKPTWRWCHRRVTASLWTSCCAPLPPISTCLCARRASHTTTRGNTKQSAAWNHCCYPLL